MSRTPHMRVGCAVLDFYWTMRAVLVGRLSANVAKDSWNILLLFLSGN